MNPCGIGQADDIETAWDYAYESDPVSIFGGIVVLNREVDAATARNAGMDCILVSWGFRERELLASYDPVAIADRPSDIWEILNR